MPKKTWKDRERKTARWFGSERNPLSGGNSRHSRSDSLHEFLFIEHKHRKTNPTIHLWDKCKEMANKESKIPVVTLSVHGRPGFWVLCKEEDLIEVAEQRKNTKNCSEPWSGCIPD